MQETNAKGKRQETKAKVKRQKAKSQMQESKEDGLGERDRGTGQQTNQRPEAGTPGGGEEEKEGGTEQKAELSHGVRKKAEQSTNMPP